MKIETYHKAYDILTECAREAVAMNQPEVRNLVEESRAKVWQAWGRLQEIELGEESETPTQSEEKTSQAQKEIEESVSRLKSSEVGQEALETLFRWFQQGRGLSLDQSNTEAVQTLLKHSWASMPGTVLEFLEEATSER